MVPTAKVTPIDADSVALWDSVALKFVRTTLANFKTFLSTAFDLVYAKLSGAIFTGAISATNLSNTNSGDEVHIGSTTPPLGTEEIWIDPTLAENSGRVQIILNLKPMEHIRQMVMQQHLMTC